MILFAVTEKKLLQGNNIIYERLNNTDCFLVNFALRNEDEEIINFFGCSFFVHTGAPSG